MLIEDPAIDGQVRQQGSGQSVQEPESEGRALLTTSLSRRSNAKPGEKQMPDKKKNAEKVDRSEVGLSDLLCAPMATEHDSPPQS